MEELIQLDSYPVKTTLDILLKDQTTKKNIIWATRSYIDSGEAYSDRFQITKEALQGLNPILIQPRVTKSLEAQQARTKSKAEVFTPSWICNKMNNYCDEEWFGRKDVFNTEEEKSWKANLAKVEFPDGKKWKDYIQSPRLEITCGEAPFIVSRYDASTGEIIPILERIGQLDRKLRIVNENAHEWKDWWLWTRHAFKSVFGYEFQGDNLLIGRINLLMTFVDYLEDKWDREPTEEELKEIATIISWNFWQMDGLTDCVPMGVPQAKNQQFSLFDFDENGELKENEEEAPRCIIKDWKEKRNIFFSDIKKEK